MTLAPGTRLGPYELTAQIGVGGMGEVYRGRDATLNRDVAIKVLPAALASDTDGRFVGRIAAGDVLGARGSGPSQKIQIVVNWVEELKRLVPVK